MATGGSSQSTSVNSVFTDDLQATVLDASGNPVPGVAVTFTLPKTGSSGSFAHHKDTAVTNADGVATAPQLLANGITGPFTVVASTPGDPVAGDFNLVIVANSATAKGNRNVTTVPSRWAQSSWFARSPSADLDWGGSSTMGGPEVFGAGAVDPSAGPTAKVAVGSLSDRPGPR
jgi:adhesin/invasin